MAEAQLCIIKEYEAKAEAERLRSAVERGKLQDQIETAFSMLGGHLSPNDLQSIRLDLGQLQPPSTEPPKAFKPPAPNSTKPSAPAADTTTTGGSLMIRDAWVDHAQVEDIRALCSVYEKEYKFV